MRPDHPQPAADPLTRYIEARRDLESTAVAPATAAWLVAAILAMAAGVPAIEATGLPVLIQAAFAESRPPAEPARGAWRRLVRANRRVLSGFSAFERSLEQESRLGQWLRPHAQALLTGRLGAGNERVYPGMDGWLFYRTDVDYVIGPAFLDTGVRRRRIAATSEWGAPPHPDPRPAIVRLAQDLAARGISLVVVPVPVKPGVHPDQLSSGAASSDDVLHNLSHATLLESLRADGVLIFDPSSPLAAARRSAPQYLMTDTHWRPEAMELIAGQLAAFIRANVTLPEAGAGDHVVERMEVRNRGDTARMLDLPDGSPLYPPESVWLRRVLRSDGSLWAPVRDAPVLLLGDSFSNIYSLESMGWGTSAGLAEQLSDTLALPVDRIVQNDAGAFATREILRQDPGRLDRTRVVIWQFAVRELAFGDWKVLPLEPR